MLAIIDILTGYRVYIQLHYKHFTDLISQSGSLVKMSNLEIMFNREARKLNNKAKYISYHERLLDLVQVRSDLVKQLRLKHEK